MARIASVVFFFFLATTLCYCLPVSVKDVQVGSSDKTVDIIDLDTVISDKHVIVKRSPSAGIIHGDKCPKGYEKAPNGQCAPIIDLTDPDFPPDYE